MKHLSAVEISPDFYVRTPNSKEGPWTLRCRFEVGPFTLPLVTYYLQFEDGHPSLAPTPSWQTQWTLLQRAANRGEWDLSDVSEDILFNGYKGRAPRPPLKEVRDFLLRGRKLLIEAHIAAVARQFVSELSSEDVVQIWGLEDVRLVMES